MMLFTEIYLYFKTWLLRSSAYNNIPNLPINQKTREYDIYIIWTFCVRKFKNHDVEKENFLFGQTDEPTLNINTFLIHFF